MSLEEITIEKADGTLTYWSEGDRSREVPALACRVASNIIRIRKALKKLECEDLKSYMIVSHFLAPFIGPLPFEKELLSGGIVLVHQALISMETP